MGSFVISPHMEVIDATDTLRAIHGMDFSEKCASHTHDDLTNHLLATEPFHMGRLDYSNYRLQEQGKNNTMGTQR